jgi:lipoprotein-releasing system permease protein
MPGVAAVAPYVQLEAIAVHGGESQPLLLQGIDPAQESTVSDLPAALRSGRIQDLATSNRIVLGALLADRLAVVPGDSIMVVIPGVDALGVPTPRLQEFEVAGLFEVGAQESDAVIAFTNIEAARALAGSDARASALRVKFTAVLQAPQLAQSLRAQVPTGFEVRDWTQDHANYFRAIRIEKTMMSLMLGLIVAIAAFNLVSMLVMVVNDKRTDIAILRTLGASAQTVKKIFLVQGLVIGWAGVVVGVAAGVLLARDAQSIMASLERWFGFEFMDSSVYYVTQLPSEIRPPQIAMIAVLALVLSLLAAWWPARRAAWVAPADALRYERL